MKALHYTYQMPLWRQLVHLVNIYMVTAFTVTKITSIIWSELCIQIPKLLTSIFLHPNFVKKWLTKYIIYDGRHAYIFYSAVLSWHCHLLIFNFNERISITSDIISFLYIQRDWVGQAQNEIYMLKVDLSFAVVNWK